MKMSGGQVFERESAEFKDALAGLIKAGGVFGAFGAAWAAINWEREAYRDASGGPGKALHSASAAGR
jgi:hypothetical protein